MSDTTRNGRCCTNRSSNTTPLLSNNWPDKANPYQTTFIANLMPIYDAAG